MRQRFDVLINFASFRENFSCLIKILLGNSKSRLFALFYFCDPLYPTDALIFFLKSSLKLKKHFLSILSEWKIKNRKLKSSFPKNERNFSESRIFILAVKCQSRVESMDACAVCGIKANQKCAGCNSVFYCSRDHQVAGWKEHKKMCKCYDVRKFMTEFMD